VAAKLVVYLKEQRAYLDARESSSGKGNLSFSLGIALRASFGLGKVKM
jgi:hypothetical protein